MGLSQRAEPGVVIPVHYSWKGAFFVCSVLRLPHPCVLFFGFRARYRTFRVTDTVLAGVAFSSWIVLAVHTPYCECGVVYSRNVSQRANLDLIHKF